MKLILAALFAVHNVSGIPLQTFLYIKSQIKLKKKSKFMPDPSALPFYTRYFLLKACVTHICLTLRKLYTTHC